MLAAWNRLQAEAAAKAEAAAEAAAKAKTAHNKWSKKIMKEFEEEDEKKREVVREWLLEIDCSHTIETLMPELLRYVKYSEIKSTALDKILKGVRTPENIDKIEAGEVEKIMEEDEKKREVVIKWLVEIGYGHPEEMLDEVITNLLRNVENYSEINETKLDEILKGVHTLEDIDKIKERRPPVSE